MSLDDKLREIISDYAIEVVDPIAADGIDVIDSAVAQIKQAFADEGYRKVHYDADDWDKIMTGQEWFSRFEKEILKAARRASGTEGKKNNGR